MLDREAVLIQFIVILIQLIACSAQTTKGIISINSCPQKISKMRQPGLLYDYHTNMIKKVFAAHIGRGRRASKDTENMATLGCMIVRELFERTAVCSIYDTGVIYQVLLYSKCNVLSSH